jgi:general secretion pathway protein N
VIAAKIRPRLNPPWTLLGCAGLLAVALGIETMRFSAAPLAGEGAPAAASAPAPGARAASFDAPPASRYVEIAERPLFIPDRRPQPDVAPASAAPGPPAPALLVQGVVLSPEHRYAVIQHGNPPKLESITVGATVDGWHVERIDAGAVTLRSGATTAEYLVGKPGAPGTQPNRPLPPRRASPG